MREYTSAKHQVHPPRVGMCPKAVAHLYIADLHRAGTTSRRWRSGAWAQQ